MSINSLFSVLKVSVPSNFNSDVLFDKTLIYIDAIDFEPANEELLSLNIAEITFTDASLELISLKKIDS